MHSDANTPSELLTAAELARALKCSVKTVRKWRTRLQCPHHVVGSNTYRYRLEEVLAWKTK